MDVNDDLHSLAELLRVRDEAEARIAEVTGRSARQGDVGEFIASRVFDIELAATATQAGHDGVFRSGPLMGRTVNIKTYGDAFTGIDISPHPCDYYLVLSGPRRPAGTVRHHQWQISEAFLFDTARLRALLTERDVKIGMATSVRKSDLEAVRVFPEPGPNSPLLLTPEQAALLALFG
ncbi:hypothetical protein HC028_23205 [Planosporangium flavigriseum]|uniref:Uncharacterized protein n=1 Tax=Planosporangium flavigriseum TaxID=373681 RepID=A0A8J3LX48_9ACTN|nr:hypothetical protein [Planosporangium flavigriseum]NJC67387.1 hypothetical protein [Planosporangium flavigriseum]GIG74980.1 hypothetical protein Pfl04_33840 [Planosporangium flavigriseum]